jgi:outer membrane protein assembly factor BamB
MVCLDSAGKILWDRAVAPYTSVQGFSSSPAFYGSAVIVPADGRPTSPNFLTALHRKTGRVVWRTPRPQDNENYASALVANVAGRDQLFIAGTCKENKLGKTISYDPKTGRKLWECPGPATYCAATVAFSKDMVFSTGGYPQKALVAINASNGKVVWKSDDKAGYVPSPVCLGGLVYAVSDKTGLMRCYDAAKGAVIWEHELESPFYSSPVIVGDKLFVFDRKGVGYIMQTGREFKLLARNTLPEGVFATPVFLDNRIYLRTITTLYCIGKER